MGAGTRGLMRDEVTAAIGCVTRESESSRRTSKQIWELDTRQKELLSDVLADREQESQSDRPIVRYRGGLLAAATITGISRHARQLTGVCWP